MAILVVKKTFRRFDLVEIEEAQMHYIGFSGLNNELLRWICSIWEV